MKTYDFDVRMGVQLSVDAETEEEARAQLTEKLTEYFADTDIEVDDSEATLLGVEEA